MWKTKHKRGYEDTHGDAFRTFFHGTSHGGGGLPVAAAPGGRTGSLAHRRSRPPASAAHTHPIPTRPLHARARAFALSCTTPWHLARLGTWHALALGTCVLAAVSLVRSWNVSGSAAGVCVLRLVVVTDRPGAFGTWLALALGTPWHLARDRRDRAPVDLPVPLVFSLCVIAAHARRACPAFLSLSAWPQVPKLVAACACCCLCSTTHSCASKSGMVHTHVGMPPHRLVCLYQIKLNNVK